MGTGALVQRLIGPRTAVDLAVFRILVVGAWLVAVDPRVAALFSTYPAGLRFPLAPWERFFTALPACEASVWAAYAIFVPAGLAALVGWKTRGALAVMLLSGGYLLSVPQFYGKINHDNHLIWFALLLMVSPCADALGVDGRKSPTLPDPEDSSVRYGLPLLIAVVLVGIAYFFPGFWKLRLVGWEWASSERMANTLHAKWVDFGGWTPWPRLDRSPLACSLGGAATVLFELGFLPLALWRRTRVPVLVGGLVFHLMTQWFMGIQLWHLALGYSALIDWTRVLPVSRVSCDSLRKTVPRAPSLLACSIVGFALVTGNLHNGIRGLQWWPLGCYPTFAALAGPRMETLRLHVYLPGGSELTITEPMLSAYSPPERTRGLCASILSSRDRERRLNAYWKLWTQLDPSLCCATHVMCTCAVIQTEPAELSPVLEEHVLLDIASP